MERILVIIDTIAGREALSGFELILFAEQAARAFSLDIQIVIAGTNVAETAGRAARYGHDVTGLEHEALGYPNPDLLARAVEILVNDIRPRFLCFQHTMRGCQMASVVSARLGISCITAVESFRSEGGKPVFKRSLYNGKIAAYLTPGTDCSAVTVLPGAFADSRKSIPRGKPGTVTLRRVAGIESPCRPLALSEAPEETIRLEDSDVIIAAGRGIGAQENLEMIRAVAKLFPNSAVGASRTICDQKWLPYAHQVGVTGKTVAPKLYMACGISGAQQHIAGMKGSQLIVAVNTDPLAGIFSISDYIIVEDLKKFLPVLIQKYSDMYDTKQ